jgi:hypothetical protein
MPRIAGAYIRKAPEERVREWKWGSGRRATLELMTRATAAQLREGGVRRIVANDVARTVRYVCPVCSAHRATLYVRDSGVGCRGCLRLAYRSEQELRYPSTEARVAELYDRAECATSSNEQVRRLSKAQRAAALLAAREEARRLRNQLATRRKLVRALVALTDDAPAPDWLDAQCADLEAALAAAEAHVRQLERPATKRKGNKAPSAEPVMALEGI